MEPIINPWVFYLINQIDMWREILYVGTLIISISLATVSVCELCNTIDFGEDYTTTLKLNSIRKTLVKLIIPLLVITLFIPSSSTLYKMIIADNVTPNNIQIVGESVEDGIDYIFDKINEVVEEGEEE